MGKEQWKKANNKYEVSSIGRVRNSTTLQILKPSKSRKGYYSVNIGKRVGLSHLVLSTFEGDCPEDKNQANHIDGNKANNGIENLEWVSASENMKHAYATGLQVMTPERKAKISEANKKYIFTEEHKKKMSEAALNRDPSTIRRGFTLSEEHKKKLSEAGKGRVVSKETREKLSKACKRRSIEKEEIL